MEYFGYFASVFIGLILGLIGGGGSILGVPILVYLFKIDPVIATAYSLFIVGTTSVIGVIKKHQQLAVNFKTGFLFGIPSIIFIFATRKWLVPNIPEVIFVSGNFVFGRRILLLGLFAVLMVFASIPMIRGRDRILSKDIKFPKAFVIIAGCLIGLLTGMVGAGGGFLIVPTLVLLLGLSFKTAVGTSLFIISINTLLGFVGDVLNYTINWPFLISITLLAIVGIIIGNKLSEYLSVLKMKRIFGWLTLSIGLIILYKELFLFS